MGSRGWVALGGLLWVMLAGMTGCRGDTEINQNSTTVVAGAGGSAGQGGSAGAGAGAQGGAGAGAGAGSTGTGGAGAGGAGSGGAGQAGAQGTDCVLGAGKLGDCKLK